jgi:hypothetical protein
MQTKSKLASAGVLLTVSTGVFAQGGAPHIVEAMMYSFGGGLVGGFLGALLACWLCCKRRGDDRPTDNKR